MFVLDPASMVCCATACCCSVGGLCAYKHRRSIPHPSEFEYIGRAYRFCGCHSHQKFDMLVEVHDIQNVTSSGKYFVEIQAGRFDARTGVCAEKKGRVDIQERLSLHVRQCDDEVIVRVKNQGVVSADLVGEVSISVKSELIDGCFPKRQAFFCQKDGKNTCKVILSFHRLDTANVKLGEFQMSPLLHQALLHAQYEAEAKGETLNVDLLNMTDIERLRFLSKVLEGPLKQMSSIGGAWKNFYFRAVERKNGKWEWQYWDSKDDCMSGVRKRGSYSFMAISLVLPDKYDRHCFYLRYHDMMGVHDLFFKRVDRDRNLWSDGLFEFIEKLREYLEKHPDATSSGGGVPPSSSRGGAKGKDGDSQLQKSSKNGRKDGVADDSRAGSSSSRISTRDGDEIRSPRGGKRGGGGGGSRSRAGSTSDLLGEKRRILSPRQTAADESIRPRASVLKGRMAHGVMYDEDAGHLAGGGGGGEQGSSYASSGGVGMRSPSSSSQHLQGPSPSRSRQNTPDHSSRGRSGYAEEEEEGYFNHRDGGNRGGGSAYERDASQYEETEGGSSYYHNGRSVHTDHQRGASSSNSHYSYKSREERYEHEEEEPLLLDQA
ncbi:transmembrane protein [Cystoisospora suis]|uniref:Transmembrane protein n=1 Tax=Cystoisospora suis TaxID=483139 RepID=A0A2C6KUX7_9APIC|nr:transmembrane protein [Cystoisospora suis]